MTATCWSHMEVGPHRGTRGGKGPRARLYNTLQQIVVDEYKRQNRRFRWIRFADASKRQIEALFSWRETLDCWHLWNFDQEAFDVIQAADNAYQRQLALVETTGVVLPQGVQSRVQAAASGAAEATGSAADWLRPPTPPSASSWLQDPRTPLPRIRPSAEERQAAKSTLRGVYAKAAETRRESSRERSTQRSRSPSPRRSKSPSTSPRRGPTAAPPVEQRAHSVEPALAREGRPSRTSLATRPIVLAPQNSIYPVTRFDEHGTWVLVREASQPREAAPRRRAQRTSGQLRQADPYLLADETWRDPPRRSSTSSRSRSPDRRPAPAEHFRLDSFSSDENAPQDAESIRTGRAAYVPRRVYEAPTHSEPIVLHSRRTGAVQPPPPKAAPKVIFGSRTPVPKEIPKAVSPAPAQADIPRKSPPRARSPVRTQSAFGYKAPPRGLNKAEPRSKSSSNPPQSGYIVKPPPPQVAQAAASSAATPEVGTRFRSPPRRAPPAPPPPPPPPERPLPPKQLTIALDWHGVLDVGQQGPHLNPEVIRHLVQFAADYAPINFIVLSFVGRAASEFRRREFQVALEHARTTSGLTFSAIKIVHERLGRGGKADALQGLGVHALIDDTASIVREAQKTGIAAFRNFPHFGPGGFANALENLGEFIESRNRQFIPAARGLHPSQYLEEIHRSASQLPARRVLR